jgi:MFS family permease
MSFLRELIPPAGVVRVLAASNLAKTTAHGILLSVSVLYFTRTVGIPATQVGLALSVGAAAGMCASIPAGRAADVLGPRYTTVGFLFLLGVFASGYAFVGGFAGLLAVTTLALMAESAANASRGALVAGLVPQQDRARALSYLRSMANLGVSFGAIAGGVALHVDTRRAYVGLLLTAGALFVVAGLAFLRVPPVPPAPAPDAGPRWVVLRDRPYAVVSLLNAVLVTNGGILLVALPIWITQRTSAPVVVYSAIVLVNTVAVVLFQVRASRGSEDVPGGARALRRSGILLAGCCALFALAAGLPSRVAVAVLLAGALVHVLGEMLYSAGSWALSFGLAPDHAQGQYQGLFGMSTQLGSMVTPLAVTTLIIGLGRTGWFLLAGSLAAAGLSAPAVARWAARARAPESAAPDPAAAGAAQTVHTGQ